MGTRTLKPLIVIVGETASGKSKLAMDLAKKFNGEIINADSWSVYEGFDIGTAKPNAYEQKIIKHHLFDIADPILGFNAAQYQLRALRKIDEILDLGKIPFLVGGTGLYVDCVIYGYSFLPESDPKLRVKYNAMSLKDLVSEAKRLNYQTDDIDLNNKRRVIRLLENKGKKPSRRPIRPNTLILGNSISPKDLRTNIERRVDLMLKSGLTSEVERLSNKYSWDIEPMKGIGYREYRKYMEGSVSLDEVRVEIIRDSLKLAQKQRTWFKRNKSIQWLDNGSDSVELITTFLNNLSGK